jgi:hypothetical protein
MAPTGVPVHLPSDLVSSFRRGQAAIFVGAEVSVAAGLPTWQQFVASLGSELDLVNSMDDSQYPPQMLMTIPQYYENRFGRRRLLDKVAELIERQHVETSEVHDLITRLPSDLLYTTNFDELFEKSLRSQSRQFGLIVSDRGARIYSERPGFQLRKIHGTISFPDTLVITRTDRSEFNREASYTLEGLRQDLAQHMFLFVGYSLSDPDFSSIYDNVLYTKGSLRQSHYICLPEVTDHESEDLMQRGLRPINLLQWPGDNTSAQLLSFLKALVEATSERFHAERFYQTVYKGQEVPIVVTSRLHETEQYVYYPACDLYTAQAVQHALELTGSKGTIIADHNALRQTGELLAQNVVLVCSPFGNAFAAEVFRRFEVESFKIPFRWTEDERGRRCIEILRTGEKFYGDDPVFADGITTFREIAVISRVKNPWAPGCSLFMFAGLHALGTHAAGAFISNVMNYRDMPWEVQEVSSLLKVYYREHDPYDYQFEVRDIEILT